MARDVDQYQRSASAIQDDRTPPVTCKYTLCWLHLTMNDDSMCDGIGLGSQLGAQGIDDRPFLSETLICCARCVSFGDDRAPHRFGVDARRAQLGRPTGLNDVIAIAALGDVLQLHS